LITDSSAVPRKALSICSKLWASSVDGTTIPRAFAVLITSFGWLLDGDFGGFFPAQNPSGSAIGR
jgi:hypothetical protein